jgi:phenylacetate-CoA ligase
MYWNRQAETLPREELRSLQLERLRTVLESVTAGVPYYQKSISPDVVTGFRSLEQIRELPFTTKQTLRDHYPFGLFAVPLREVVRLHASSGTTGQPTVVGYTSADMELWAEVMARTLTAGGVDSNDIVHNAYGYGLFTGGLGFGLGGETVGATVVPVSSGLTARQIQLLVDFGATVLCCTPSYALVLAEHSRAQGIDLRKRSRLRVGFFGAEPWTEGMRFAIEDTLGIEAFDIYGLSEIIGPGVAIECGEHDGLHVFEDHFLVEVVDPDTGEPSPVEPSSPAEGELVLTTLTKKALPLIRYRTRDRVAVNPAPCACGRTSVRMSKVLGRTDDMLIVRGVNVFPSQIETALLEVAGMSTNYQIVVDRTEGRLDEIEVRAEPVEDVYTDPTRRDAVSRAASSRIHEIAGLRARVVLVSPGSIPRSEGKAARVVDRRQLASSSSGETE